MLMTNPKVQTNSQRGVELESFSTHLVLTMIVLNIEHDKIYVNKKYMLTSPSAPPSIGNLLYIVSVV